MNIWDLNRYAVAVMIGRGRGGALRWLGRAVLLAVFFWASGAAAQQPKPTSLELEDALEAARQNAPLRAELRAGQDLAEARQTRAQRGRWPSFSAESLLAPVPDNADPTRIDENLDELRSLNIGPYFRQNIRMTVPLYTFGRISTLREMAELGVDVAKWQGDASLQEHLFRTRQAYYGRQLAAAFEEVLDEGLGLVKDTLAEMEEDRAFGEADFSTNDLRRLQVFDAQLDAMVLDNARLRDMTEAALEFLMDEPRPFSVSPLDADRAAAKSLAELAAYQEYARTHRPDLKQLHHGVEVRRLEERLARREQLPAFFFAANFTYGWATVDPARQPVCRIGEPGGPCEFDDTLFARPYSNPFDTFNIGVALGMRWTFDLGQGPGRVREAQARVARVEAQRTRALGAIDLEIEEAWRGAHDARERMTIERRRYDIARRWRNQYGLRADFADGDLNMRELIDPLSEFYDARVSYLEAAFNYLVARAELATKIGVEDLAEVPEFFGRE